MSKTSEHTQSISEQEDETFGQRLKRLRNEIGLTQQTLADRIGIIRELISDYERGRLRPHYDIVAKLAVALEVSADRLLGIDTVKTPPKKTDPQIQKILQKIEALPEKKKKNLLQIITLYLNDSGSDE